MQKWKVTGADRATGAVSRIVVEAPDSGEAAKEGAAAGLYVSDVRPVPDSGTPPLADYASAAPASDGRDGRSEADLLAGCAVRMLVLVFSVALYIWAAVMILEGLSGSRANDWASMQTGLLSGILATLLVILHVLLERFRKGRR